MWQMLKYLCVRTHEVVQWPSDHIQCSNDGFNPVEKVAPECSLPKGEAFQGAFWPGVGWGKFHAWIFVERFNPKCLYSRTPQPCWTGGHFWNFGKQVVDTTTKWLQWRLDPITKKDLGCCAICGDHFAQHFEEKSIMHCSLLRFILTTR